MNTRTIVRNTAWYGLENVISFVTSLVTSIAIARTLGPSEMGYIIYVMWLSSVAGSFGSIGIPNTTRKYMAEYLGAGDRATARFIYLRSLWAQFGMATLATSLSLIWVLHDAPPNFRVAASLLVLSILPSMVNGISAQANVAAEQLSANLPASVTGTAVFFILTFLSIGLHWGVVGIASAMFSMRTIDFLVRFIPTFRRIYAWAPIGHKPPTDLNRRMLSFALQSVMGMAVTLVVWDRSELFLLKHLSPDIRQIAFYSVAFNLAERLLVFPTVFASATGASVMAQFGRDRTRLPAMTAAAVRYLGLTSIPLHVIAVALAGPALVAMYGEQYRGAILVATWAPLLCLPKAFLGPIQTFFESIERQIYFNAITITASLVDIGVAWWLIPKHGALGASLGSGTAQALAVGALWLIGIRLHGIRLPYIFFAKITAISVVSALLAHEVARNLSPLPGFLGGGVLAVLLFLVLASVVRVFEAQDLARFRHLLGYCPAMLIPPANKLLLWLGSRVAPSQELVS